MALSTVISVACSLLGTVITVVTLSRKLVTKSDIAELKSDLKKLTDKSNDHAERIAVLEYQVKEYKEFPRR